jgi:uncharacterized membrane protein
MMNKTIRILALSLVLVAGILSAVNSLAGALLIGGWGATSFREAVLSISGLIVIFAVPLCLISGSLLGFLKKAHAFSSVACILGSLGITALVVQEIYADAHRNSAELPMGVGYLTVIVMTALLCDLSTAWIGLDWKRNRSSLGV